MDRERVIQQHLEERAVLEMKYLDVCKPIYEERGKIVAGRLYDEIERIHEEGGGEKEEEEGSKGDNGGDGDDTGEGEEREGAASLEDGSNYDEIYSAIASGQGTTTTNTKDDTKDDDDEEWRMVWVCKMGHTEAASESLKERDIDCL